MKLCVFLLCVLVGVNAMPFFSKIRWEWKLFKALNKKHYKTTGEEILRLKIYLTNKLAIMTHNQRERRSGSTFKVKMNEFGDLLYHEYAKMAAGKLVKKVRRRGGYYVPSGKPLPRQVDLRRRRLITPVKHQGYTCGSCWTFSTTAAMEGAYARKTGKLINLSPQNILDCVTDDNYGCKGGYEFDAFLYASYHGINLAKDYPYTEVQGPCRVNSSKFTVKLDGFEAITPGDENALMDAIHNVGPLTVGIDDSSPLFRFYSSGIYAPSAYFCRADNVSHSLLAIGYGSADGDDYWLLKNSWGTNWGENGYMRVLRDGTNFCGIATDPYYPLLF